MARIFISYRRDDTKHISARIHDRLVNEFGRNKVFYDVDRNIPAGSTWKEVLETRLSESDVLLVIIGDKWERIINERRNSDDWVRFEVEHGLNRDDMLVIPILVENAAVPQNLSAKVSSLTDRQIFRVRHDPDFNGDMQRLSKTIREWQSKKLNITPYIIGIFAILIIVVLSILLSLNLLNGNSTSSPDELTQIVLNEVSETTTLSDEPIETLTASYTPEIATLVAQLDATATVQQATLFIEETFVARATEYAQGTLSVQNQTATATLWTDTPTPNITASVDAFRTQQAATITQEWIDSWTSTPTSTHTPTQTPLTVAIEQARSFVGRENSDWQPYIHVFNDGHEMALVPVGCVVMGDDRGDDDERPVIARCVREPFWMDVTEITNAAYGSVGCEQWSSEPTQPRNCITWRDALTHCQARNGSLPTELQWEYAARGVESDIYPWGNTFLRRNAVYELGIDAVDNRTLPVGSIPSGASWVGVLDMAGNVAEWVSSAYEDYPYVSYDGREDLDNRLPRVFRGGSSFSSIEDLRSADRFVAGNSDFVFSGVGFRCVLPIEAAQ